MKEILDLIKADPCYQKNIEYEPCHDGHPEGKIKYHIADLEANLEILAGKNISESDYWKLKFIIHVHDLFKVDAQNGLPTLHPQNHASLAKQYASQYTDDTDLLNMIQFHDENYKLWREYLQTKIYNRERFQVLLDTIKNWDLFLIFIIIDGCTIGKDPAKIRWFIDEVRKFKNTLVDATWIIPPEKFRTKEV